MRIRIGRNPVPAILVVALVTAIVLSACNPVEPGTVMVVRPEATVTDEVVQDPAAVCDRHGTLATLRAAVPFSEYALYFTARPEPNGDPIYGLTFWYVDEEIKLQGDGGDLQAMIFETANRAAEVIDTVVAADECVTDLFDVLLLGVVDSAYNSWYLGNVAVADLLEGASADTLLTSQEILLPETWPEAVSESSDGSCTWTEATASMETCTGENGGCLLALTEQIGPISVVQTTLPMPLEEWTADRDRDMALAEAARAGLDCVAPSTEFYGGEFCLGGRRIALCRGMVRTGQPGDLLCASRGQHGHIRGRRSGTSAR